MTTGHVSTTPWDGNDLDTYADDLAAVIDLSEPFYGANRDGAKVSQGLRDSSGSSP